MIKQRQLAALWCYITLVVRMWTVAASMYYPCKLLAASGILGMHQTSLFRPGAYNLMKRPHLGKLSFQEKLCNYNIRWQVFWAALLGGNTSSQVYGLGRWIEIAIKPKNRWVLVKWHICDAVCCQQYCWIDRK